MTEQPKRWFKRAGLRVRILIGVLLLILSLPFAFKLWMWANSHDLEPPDVSDLRHAPPVIEEGENAYPVLQEIMRSMSWSMTSEEEKAYLNGEDADRSIELKIAQALDANTECLDQVFKAAELNLCANPGPPSSFQTRVEFFKELRTFPGMMRSFARYESASGNDSRSVDLCLALFQCGQLYKQHPDAILYYLMGISWGEEALQEMIYLIQGGSLSDEDLGRITRVLSEAESDAVYLRRAIKNEYRVVEEMMEFMRQAMEKDAGEDIFGEGQKLGVVRKYMTARYLFHPNRTLHQCAEHFRGMLRNVDKPFSKIEDSYHEQLMDNDVSALRLMFRRNMVGEVITGIAMPVFNSTFRRRCLHDAQVANVSALAALELYRREHGELPGALDALTPDLITSIPLDPFNGKPLGYIPEEQLIYSVGADGVYDPKGYDDIVIHLKGPAE